MSAVSPVGELSTELIQKNPPAEVSVAITEKVETVVQTCIICEEPASGRQFRHTDDQGVDLHPDAVIDERCMNRWRTYNNNCPFCRTANPQTIVPRANPQTIVPREEVPQEDLRYRSRRADCCACMCCVGVAAVWITMAATGHLHG